MDIREELKSAGVYPTGPCSAWPVERNNRLIEATTKGEKRASLGVKASGVQMAKGLFSATVQAVQHGKVSKEVRDERYETCKACPSFIEGSKRCAECGCFMEAKTWIGGDKAALCPLNKWSR